METPKEYFDKEYGKEHIQSVIDLKDSESLYGLMQEFSDNQRRELLIAFTEFVNDQLAPSDMFSSKWIDDFFKNKQL